MEWTGCPGEVTDGGRRQRALLEPWGCLLEEGVQRKTELINSLSLSA